MDHKAIRCNMMNDNPTQLYNPEKEQDREIRGGRGIKGVEKESGEKIGKEEGRENVEKGNYSHNVTRGAHDSRVVFYRQAHSNARSRR